MQINRLAHRPQLSASPSAKKPEKEHHYEDMRDALDRMGDGTTPSWFTQVCPNGRQSNGERLLGKCMTLGITAFAAGFGYLQAGMSGALIGGALGAPLVAIDYMVNGR